MPGVVTVDGRDFRCERTFVLDDDEELGTLRARHTMAPMHTASIRGVTVNGRPETEVAPFWTIREDQGS